MSERVRESLSVRASVGGECVSECACVCASVGLNECVCVGGGVWRVSA